MEEDVVEEFLRRYGNTLIVLRGPKEAIDEDVVYLADDVIDELKPEWQEYLGYDSGDGRIYGDVRLYVVRRNGRTLWPVKMRVYLPGEISSLAEMRIFGVFTDKERAINAYRTLMTALWFVLKTAMLIMEEKFVPYHEGLRRDIRRLRTELL